LILTQFAMVLVIICTLCLLLHVLADLGDELLFGVRDALPPAGVATVLSGEAIGHPCLLGWGTSVNDAGSEWAGYPTPSKNPP